MDLTTYCILYFSFLAMVIFSLYSKHKNLVAVAGIGFVILGFLMLASPLQHIVGEVIIYG